LKRTFSILGSASDFAERLDMILTVREIND
jgi:hypothetical protein